MADINEISEPRLFPDHSGGNHASGQNGDSSNNNNHHANNEDHDDDTEKEGVPAKPDFHWEDTGLHHQTLLTLNKMRKNKHFCDVILQIGKQDIPAHRAVLAAASPYLMELFTSSDDQPTRKEAEGTMVYQLNGGFDKQALERLIEFAYTARLDVPSCQVRSVYGVAIRLKMDRAACECAKFLASNIDLETCLEIRGMSGISRLKDLVEQVDGFIEANMEQLQSSRQMISLPRLCIEVLHGSKEEMDAAQSKSICQLVLDWIHSQWLEDQKLSLEKLAGKKHLLYLGKNNTMQDCDEIEEGSANDSDIIKDYKKVNQQMPKSGKKIRRHSQIQPAKPRELLYSRHINQEDSYTEDHSEDWKLVSFINMEGKSILAVITVEGKLATCSIIQRLNRPNSPSALATVNSLFQSLPSLSKSSSSTFKSKSPSISRPPSVEKDLFAIVANMNEAKCAVGAGCLENKLVVCGGYDRGECLRSVSVYDVEENSWSDLASMQAKRGRFDITIRDNVIYAVAGSNGTAEQPTCEKYEDGKWTNIANLPVPVSNIGLCTLNGEVFCIGGTYGQSGNKHCFKLIDDGKKWERIASLLQGRSQAGVCSFQGKIWVVGGSDAWNPLSSVEMYDPATNSWRQGPPMNTPRRGCGLVERNNLLYVIGGSDGTQSLCTTEIYDPRMNLWTAGPNMTTCRANVSATVVGDKIWAVGGFSGKVFLNTTEYLDPRRDEWTTYMLADPTTPETPSTTPAEDEEELPSVDSEAGAAAASNEATSDPAAAEEATVKVEVEEEKPKSAPPPSPGVRFTIEGLKNGEPILLSPRGSTSSSEGENNDLQQNNDSDNDASKNCAD